MSTQKPNETEFNVIQFEKRLTSLKDSQEHINACCRWCLENRSHHKKIVLSWLNVLKRVKIEQRVNLFYLANDVIQYSKRRGYDFVESWGTALQKATTLVRDEKVKHKIVRIFNIWEQRGVYNEEFISDLCGLISAVPTSSNKDEPHEFQASYVINKIKQCSKLENDTDAKLKVLKEHNPKIQIESDSFMSSLKDRAHVDDVEKELDVYAKHLEGYINALKAEIKCRINNISVLRQANTHLDKDKRDVKVVANAYRTFGQRVRTFQKKLEEHKKTLNSPVPSPDVNAPSPSPDLDIELPGDENLRSSLPKAPYDPNTQYGFYNPVPPPSVPTTANFVTNGYTSFIGTNFNVDSLTASSLFTSTRTATATTEVTNSGVFNISSVPPPPPKDSISQPYQPGHLPLLPPPMPPFNPKNDYDSSYNNSTTSSISYDGSYQSGPPLSDSQFSNPSVSDYDLSGYDQSLEGTNPYPPDLSGEILDAYNPEEDPESWEGDVSWNQSGLESTDTPESPPIFEKEGGYNEPIEYHDTINVGPSGHVTDVDHRVLRPLADLDKGKGRGKDVDHRNLISLTGSPADSNAIWNENNKDQDYRTPSLGPPGADQDYRMPFNIENLKLPPPPPPPPTSQVQFLKGKPIRVKAQDNVESIDMDLCEDDLSASGGGGDSLSDRHFSSLKPPPPLPDLPDDVDANSFLDTLNDELNSSDFNMNLSEPPQQFIGAQFSMPPPPLPLLATPLVPLNWGHKFRLNIRGRNGNNNMNNRGGGRNHRPGRGFNRGRGNNNNNDMRSGRGGGGFARGPLRNNRQRGNFRGNFQGGF